MRQREASGQLGESTNTNRGRCLPVSTSWHRPIRSVRQLAVTGSPAPQGLPHPTPPAQNRHLPQQQPHPSCKTTAGQQPSPAAIPPSHFVFLLHHAPPQLTTAHFPSYSLNTSSHDLRSSPAGISLLPCSSLGALMAFIRDSIKSLLEAQTAWFTPASCSTCCCLLQKPPSRSEVWVPPLPHPPATGPSSTSQPFLSHIFIRVSTSMAQTSQSPAGSSLKTNLLSNPVHTSDTSLM